VSLQNKPVSALVEPAATADGSQAEITGPYVHRVELVVDGRYLDIVKYLHALEALPWHFYWRSLDLKTTEYPMNRVHIELSTLSLDKDWIGV
jgi:MSHA biogenesis protein MshJ